MLESPILVLPLTDPKALAKPLNLLNSVPFLTGCEQKLSRGHIERCLVNVHTERKEKYL